MRRTLPFVALWIAAGGLAAGIATAGVAVVNDQLTGSRPAPLTAAEVRRQVDAASSERTTTPTTEPSTSSTTAPGATASTTAPRDDGASDGTAPPAATTSTTASPEAVTRTFELVGGTTTIRFSPTGVEVLSATPKPGFAAEVEPEGSGMKVEFESEAHRSRIDAWWAGGPQTETREDAR